MSHKRLLLLLAFLVLDEPRMPPEFVVGSNPAGERLIISCGDIAIPFAFPKTGSYGWQTQFASSTDGRNMTRWSAKWSEDTVSYWLLLILLALGPAVVGIGRLIRRIKAGGRTFAE